MEYCICSALDTFEFGFACGMFTISALCILVLLVVRMVVK